MVALWSAWHAFHPSTELWGVVKPLPPTAEAVSEG
jgi:hypothetical protein